MVVRYLTVFEEHGVTWDLVAKVNQTELEYYADGSGAQLHPLLWTGQVPDRFQ